MNLAQKLQAYEERYHIKKHENKLGWLFIKMYSDESGHREIAIPFIGIQTNSFTVFKMRETL